MHQAVEEGRCGEAGHDEDRAQAANHVFPLEVKVEKVSGLPSISNRPSLTRLTKMSKKLREVGDVNAK